MPRGRGIDRNVQLRCTRSYEENDRLEPWERDEEYLGVRKLADIVGVSKSTVHRYVNREALEGDRRRSARRRERVRRGACR